MTEKLIRLKTPAGKPVVVDATRRPVKVAIQDGDKGHTFTLGYLGADDIFTKEGPNIKLDAESYQRVTAFLASIAVDVSPDAPTQTKPGFIEITYYTTRVIFDGDTVNIYRKGMMDPHKGQKVIAVSQISSVQLKEPGLTAGYIQFVFSGSSESKSGVWDAATDENAVMFRGKENTAQFKRLRDAIMAKVVALKSGGSKSPAPVSALDELEKLASLRDRGIVTEEEFAAKKQQLLGL